MDKLPVPDEAEDEPSWYPAGWKADPDQPIELRGVRVVLEGGPLDGRTAHMRDASFSLWVARRPDRELVVRGTRELPEIPLVCEQLGRYVYDPLEETMRWHEGWEGV